MSDFFEKLAINHGLGAYAALIRKYLLPCVGFSLEPGVKGNVGNSHLGAGPDVPDNFNWPVSKGRPLDFLLQVNLRELPRDNALHLPSEGLLSFFYDMKEQPWGYDPKALDGHRVFLFPGNTQLKRRPVPDAKYGLKESSMSFWPAMSLPNVGGRDYSRMSSELKAAGIEDESPLHDAYFELMNAIFEASAPSPQNPFHHMGGHSHNIQGDMQLEAQLVMNGLNCGDTSGYRDPRAEELAQTCEEWKMLLQLDSDDDAGFMWGDCGMLYFWTRSSDVARQDFAKVWMSLQCY